MGYYLRVLTPNTAHVPAAQLRERLIADGLDAALRVTDGAENAWDELMLSHRDGTDIAQVWRNPVDEGELGGDEVEEFSDEVRQARPASAAAWLQEFLPKVRVIYAIQVFHTGVERGQGWEVIHAVQGELWGTLGGILQADGEGFSNEDGYHILWQFSSDVTGPWRMAVLSEAGGWVPFEMDLGNLGHRTAFLEGKVPEGASLL